VTCRDNRVIRNPSLAPPANGDKEMSDTISTEPLVRPRAKPSEKTRLLPPYHVILENDDHHSFDFVISVLRKVFGVSEERAMQFALEAHKSGRSIVWTGAKEVAELKVEQIHSFAEIRADGAKLGPLGAFIEPAE
jgi:ATP-dependent Clp protease adaptor protein ClpS